MSLTPESLVNKSLALVSPPHTYSQLNELMHAPNSSVDDISAVINTDPALATRLLKVVNSPFYGFPSQINTISRAITIIGTRELTNLVLATSVMNSFKGIPNNLMNMDEFWRHSLACAIAAKYLAQHCSQRTSEQFFIAGLLHNIGCLVIYQSVPELAKEAINSARFGHELIYKAEQRILGFDHTEVGQALVHAWRLPISLEEVVRFHHMPSKAQQFPVEVAIVHVADVMVSAAEFGHSGDQHVPSLDHDAWELLGLDASVLPEILQQVSDQLDDLASLMKSS
ncbi:MAG: HDOD domain-containing protein [Gammaproteobacteria bacterium]|nr:HDOD domain-containing protein [Gammaproteobacteria bacterium]MDH5592098.1 HDOD domain-containing protein [Gammaproteobacteria bacterium]